MTEQELNPLTDAERLTAHLEEASRIVASWPEWKRNVLGVTRMDQPTVWKFQEQKLRLKIEALQQNVDELRSALCIARENARTQHGMTLRKFAVLCGHSPSWVSRWTDCDTDLGQPDFVD